MPLIRILLVQLAANGDCLFVTTIARQIKTIDFPGCHLTWLIGSKFRSVLNNNPYVDEVIEIPIRNTEEMIAQRLAVDRHIDELQASRSFEHVFITDYVERNYRNWFGTTRSSLFRSYPKRLSIDPQPQVFLTEEEVRHVGRFCTDRNIGPGFFNILFECSPQSGQSRMTFDTALGIARGILERYSRVHVILSSAVRFDPDDPRLIDGSVLSWRENAELANRCHLLVGCSSGISWLCTSSWTKRLPFIQVVNSNYVGGRFSASMKLDFRFFGLDTSDLVELNNPSDQTLTEVIAAAVEGRFAEVAKTYGETDNRAFRHFRFLREAKIGIGEKMLLFGTDYLPHRMLSTWRSFKPDWFRPVAWLKKNHRLDARSDDRGMAGTDKV